MRPHIARLVLSVMAFGAFAPQLGQAADPTAAEVAQSLQRRYDTVHDFSADFVHSYQGGVLKKVVTESGRLQVKKPGRMKWEYRSPEQKVFVSDGTKMYSYIPQDKQVIVGTVPAEDNASTPALFLAGKGNLLRDFTPALTTTPPGMAAGMLALKLVPKSAQPDYDWLILVAERTTLALRGLVTIDAQGGTSTFSFANLKENVGLTDKDFAFKMPRGVDVVTDGSRR
jgi:outer membrane lipoprotein carrier protein